MNECLYMYLVQYLVGDSVYILQEMGLNWRMQFVRTQLARNLAVSKLYTSCVHTSCVLRTQLVCYLAVYNLFPVFFQELAKLIEHMGFVYFLKVLKNDK